ncbi:MAG: hypothetical protein K8E24_003100 [Methanobacterium paludis]|nr:hypothetical protein [Methanobacterium paludis]
MVLISVDVNLLTDWPNSMTVWVFDTESTYEKVDGVWYLKKVYKHKPRITEAYVRVTNAFHFFLFSHFAASLMSIL